MIKIHSQLTTKYTADMKTQFRWPLQHISFLAICLVLLSGFTFSQPNLPSVFPDRIVLNPTPDPLTSLAITWRTDTTVHVGFCEWQLATDTKIKAEESNSVKSNTKTVEYQFKDEPKITVNQHSLILSGLLPSTEYIYRVGFDANWSEWFQFRTPGKKNEEFSFVYFGDPQVGLKTEWPRVIRKAYQQCPDCRFMLYAGDIINRAERDIEWQEWFDAGSFIFSTIPQIMTPGNHDYNGLTVDHHWNSQFSQPTNGPKGLKGTCFFVDYPKLRLISIDSATDSELEDENGFSLQAQKIWLDSVLFTNKKEWVIVTTHLPFYSTKENRDNPQLRKHFQPLLEKYKVDLVLTGHDHSYGRGRASDNINSKHTVVYVVSVSGSKFYLLGTKPWMEQSAGNLELFQTITINENTLVYKSYTASGLLFDELMLKRNGNGVKKFFEFKPRK